MLPAIFIYGIGARQEFYVTLFSFILQNINVAKIISKSFPPALWGAVSITDYKTLSGFLNLLLFIGISAIFTIALAVFAQRMYFKAVILGQEVEA